MAKKKTKEEIKQSDILIKTIGSIVTFVRNNLKLCIIGVIILFVVGLSVYGYMLYEKRQNEKAQNTLFQGINNFEVYTLSGKEDDLNKAEGIFRKVVKEKQGKTSDIAKLYLGKIYSIKGKDEEAKKVYEEILKESSETVLKMLSEKALQHIEKK
ncbi:MAG: tetratricopeptide repeat protein [Proteobacteria bacterium]|nr:tetratricopeptide repeat protein [Pseudomonadota bacterium]